MEKKEIKVGDKVIFMGKPAEVVFVGKQYTRIRQDNFLIDTKPSNLK